jgi:hypothetical protein
MSPALQVAIYAAAIVCFVLAALGFTGGARRPIALGWLGVALVTLVLLVGAVEAV